MSSYLPTTTSLSPSIVLSIKDSLVTLDEENKMKNTLFWEALGLLMWLEITIRPDLVFSVNILTCFAYNPRKAY